MLRRGKLIKTNYKLLLNNEIFQINNKNELFQTYIIAIIIVISTYFIQVSSNNHCRKEYFIKKNKLFQTINYSREKYFITEKIKRNNIVERKILTK